MEIKKQMFYVEYYCIFDTAGICIAHIAWHSEDMELTFKEECFSFIQGPKLCKNMQFAAAAGNYMAKKL